ncbi:MAG TPA: SCO family protein [Caulobacteraceae bacterium]|nr:SCO family protein [Caulobacteraceae bacterium]
MTRRLPWILLAAFLGLATAAAIVAWQLRPHPEAPAPSAIGGDFRLVDQNGRLRTQDLLRGKWSVVFFGYTYCPDICPTTLAQLGAAERALGPRAKTFQVVFVSVDPERDTPAALKRYLSAQTFPHQIVGLTGTPAQVAAAAKAYKVYYAKVPQGSTYLMDHSAASYLMDPSGRFVKPLDLAVPPADVAAQIERAMG